MIKDKHLYVPYYSPWLGDSDFTKHYHPAQEFTLVSPDRCYVIYSLLIQSLKIDGDVWECGVYRGGMAVIIGSVLAEFNSRKEIFLFDTFEGMPEYDPEKDSHKKGDFSNTSYEEVVKLISYPKTTIVKGIIPESLSKYEDKSISFAHIDLDNYKSTKDCLEFVFPRITVGGFLVMDDYGTTQCHGVRLAVDEYFKDTIYHPLVMPGCQAVIIKNSK